MSRKAHRAQSLFTLLFGAAAVLVFAAATCKKESETPAPAAKGSSAPAELQGIDLSALPEAARGQLLAFASDEFCFCGCPHTLAGCLKEHPSCPHAKRMLSQAARLALAGARSAEIIRELGAYYNGFPKEKRKLLDLSNAVCRGPASAPITLVEFSDFQCPFCGAARPVLERIAEEQKSRVQLCFKNFPLSSHEHSLLAAQAVEFAREKGRFWELHDALFEHQLALKLEDIKGYARSVGLDADALEKAVVSEVYLPRVNASKNEGQSVGVDSTPAIFINGRPLALSPSYEALQQAIEDELEYAARGAWSMD